MLFSKYVLGYYGVNFLFFLGRAHNQVDGLIHEPRSFRCGFNNKTIQFNSWKFENNCLN